MNFFFLKRGIKILKILQSRAFRPNRPAWEKFVAFYLEKTIMPFPLKKYCPSFPSFPSFLPYFPLKPKEKEYVWVLSLMVMWGSGFHNILLSPHRMIEHLVYSSSGSLTFFFSF